jgi:hypothetical protein
MWERTFTLRTTGMWKLTPINSTQSCIAWTYISSNSACNKIDTTFSRRIVLSRPAIAASPESHILSDSACFKGLIIRWFGAISPHQPLSAPISLRKFRLLQTMFAVQVSWDAMRHANNLKICLALISSAWILNICRLSNGPFLNLGATCFRTEWLAHANFRRLLLRDSPFKSSQQPRLPKFNFGNALPTRCTNYSVLVRIQVLPYILYTGF